jgi:hypothetical protein
MTALAQGQPPVRRSLQGLAWNDPIVTTYREAVGIMKQKPESEQFSWVNLSKIHGSDPNTYHFCPHGDWYFLPWHRAYTAMCERIVRLLTTNKDFAMPFWDWTADPLMPQVFLSPKTPDGKTNWLYVSETDRQRTWPPNLPMPPENVGPDVLRKILAATEYEQFGTSRNRKQDSLDPKWITIGGGIRISSKATHITSCTTTSAAGCPPRRPHGTRFSSCTIVTSTGYGRCGTCVIRILSTASGPTCPSIRTSIMLTDRSGLPRYPTCTCPKTSDTPTD